MRQSQSSGVLIAILVVFIIVVIVALLIAFSNTNKSNGGSTNGTTNLTVPNPNSSTSTPNSQSHSILGNLGESINPNADMFNGGSDSMSYGTSGRKVYDMTYTLPNATRRDVEEQGFRQLTQEITNGYFATTDGKFVEIDDRGIVLSTTPKVSYNYDPNSGNITVKTIDTNVERGLVVGNNDKFTIYKPRGQNLILIKTGDDRLITVNGKPLKLNILTWKST